VVAGRCLEECLLFLILLILGRYHGDGSVTITLLMYRVVQQLLSSLIMTLDKYTVYS
jgi:hypothetical protein